MLDFDEELEIQQFSLDDKFIISRLFTTPQPRTFSACLSLLGLENRASIDGDDVYQAVFEAEEVLERMEMDAAGVRMRDMAYMKIESAMAFLLAFIPNDKDLDFLEGVELRSTKRS